VQRTQLVDADGSVLEPARFTLEVVTGRPCSLGNFGTGELRRGSPPPGSDRRRATRHSPLAQAGKTPRGGTYIRAIRYRGRPPQGKVVVLTSGRVGVLNGTKTSSVRLAAPPNSSVRRTVAGVEVRSGNCGRGSGLTFFETRRNHRRVPLRTSERPRPVRRRLGVRRSLTTGPRRPRGEAPATARSHGERLSLRRERC
jgi:hypothetical protein